MKYSLALIFISFLLLSGCAQPQPTYVKCNERAWMLNPNSNGHIGAVGSAMQTYDQKSNSQRKLAISRALDELSLQRGVKVKLTMQKQDLVTNDTSHSSIKTQSNYSTNNTVTAHIQDTCKDKLSGEFFVWMLLD